MKRGPRLATAVLCGLPTVAAAGELSANRQQELIHLLRHDCGSCHGLTMKGALGPPLLPDALADKDDAPGTPMPPWRTQLSPAETAWLVQALRTGPPR